MATSAAVADRGSRREQLWAELADAGGLGGAFDEALAPLVQAAGRTALRQLMPFTSMARLCFTAAETVDPSRGVQPGFIEFFPGPRYVVFSGSPFAKTTGQRVRLETNDATDAVAALVDLISSTPGS